MRLLWGHVVSEWTALNSVEPGLGGEVAANSEALGSSGGVGTGGVGVSFGRVFGGRVFGGLGGADFGRASLSWAVGTLVSGVVSDEDGGSATHTGTVQYA